jgi:polysaccharide biosynthesis/export protein
VHDDAIRFATVPKRRKHPMALFGLALPLILALAACAGRSSYPDPPAAPAPVAEGALDYLIEPLDTLSIFVWRAPDLSTTALVRPDGRISVPLLEDTLAAGRTTTELAADLQDRFMPFVQEPLVTVSVVGLGFSTGSLQAVRVVGEARSPGAVPYQDDLSVLDLMVAAGGLGEFAAGNRALLIRRNDQDESVYGLRLTDLLEGGDMSVDVPLLPGDVVLIPRSLL